MPKIKDGRKGAGGVKKHVQALELPNEKAYRAWCQKQGIGTGTHKSQQQRKKEKALANRLKGERALRAAKRQRRRPEELVELIFAGRVKRAELKMDFLAQVWDEVQHLGDDQVGLQALRELVLGIRGRSKLDRGRAHRDNLAAQNIMRGLAALAQHRADWLRPLAQWRPQSHNVQRQFSELARHLLARYEVPRFMDRAWFESDREKGQRYQEWFKHIGVGHNIRRADLPLPLSKKMAHLFLQADECLTIEAALRWAQVRAQGGSQELAEAIIGTRLGTSFAPAEFWDGVILFLSQNPMLDPACVGPIIDYIHYQRFVPVETVLNDGQVETLLPPQPNFSLKGRRIERLLAQVEQWHLTLGKEERKPTHNWARSGIGEFELVEDSKDEQRRWSIGELTSSQELVAEGRIMRHCVSSYERNCKRGNMSIWSLKVQYGDGRVQSVMTIAVDSHTRRVTQARGKYNATSTGPSQDVSKSNHALLNYSQRMMKVWKQREGLS